MCSPTSDLEHQIRTYSKLKLENEENIQFIHFFNKTIFYSTLKSARYGTKQSRQEIFNGPIMGPILQRKIAGAEVVNKF